MAWFAQLLILSDTKPGNRYGIENMNTSITNTVITMYFITLTTFFPALSFTSFFF
jgi:preprotein translocase subunit SecF